MTDFFEIFQPGLRFKREQEDLEKVLVVEADKGGTGPRPLDLDSGSVLLRMPQREASGTAETPAGDEPPEADETPAGEEPREADETPAGEDPTGAGGTS